MRVLLVSDGGVLRMILRTVHLVMGSNDDKAAVCKDRYLFYGLACLLRSIHIDYQ
jgi:hypothetical protein